MRAVAALLLACGCYRPSVAPGVPCADNGVCPLGQHCDPTSSLCEPGDAGIPADAAPDALAILPDAKLVDAPANAVVVALTSGTSWHVPQDWNNANNSIECIGGGGAGAVDGGGGGGGAYAYVANVQLQPGLSIAYAIGARGNGHAGDGGPSYVCTTSTCTGLTDQAVAVGAIGGTGSTSASGGAGGAIAASIGTTVFAGGNGGDGGMNGDDGGGGGGAAGPLGNGGNGGVGGADSDDGGGGGGGNGGGANGGNARAMGQKQYGGSGGNNAGGSGGTPATTGDGDGGNGGLYGAGGGGSSDAGTPGDGAAGLCVIIYTP